MPELPEVETIRRTLKQLIVGKTIERVEVKLPRIIMKPDDIEQFCLDLQGQTFRSVERRGKFLRFILDDIVMVSHLRMEGKYALFSKDDPVDKHVHVIFYFSDGSELRYNDVRQFGTMHLFAPGEEFEQPPLAKLGLEPLDEQFTLQAFNRLIDNRTGKIKPFLLNQAYVVGLGNIYVDEALHMAGIHPERAAGSLKKSERKKLYEAIVYILQEAVEAGGSSIRSYVQGDGEMGMFQQNLKVYGRKSEACYTCGCEIERIVLGGRGTHLCLKCQPKR